MKKWKRLVRLLDERGSEENWKRMVLEKQGEFLPGLNQKVAQWGMNQRGMDAQARFEKRIIVK